MRRLWLCGAIVILGSTALAACQPYGYGYDRYYGYGAYGTGQYAYGPGYGPYAGYPMAPPAPPYTVPQSLSQTSYNFVINLAVDDSYEIEAGRLAALRSASPQVRQFADRVVAGNTTVTQDLTAALQWNGTPVVTPAALDPRHQAMIGDLGAVQGPEFDRRYVIQQVVAHREAVAMLQNYIQNGDNQDLRQLAQKTLPEVQAGLQMAQNLPGAYTSQNDSYAPQQQAYQQQPYQQQAYQQQAYQQQAYQQQAYQQQAYQQQLDAYNREKQAYDQSLSNRNSTRVVATAPIADEWVTIYPAGYQRLVIFNTIANPDVSLHNATVVDRMGYAVGSFRHFTRKNGEGAAVITLNNNETVVVGDQHLRFDPVRNIVVADLTYNQLEERPA